MDSEIPILEIGLEKTEDPLGFIVINPQMSLEEARKKLLEEEIEGLPEDFRFLLNHNNTFVKISLKQESSLQAIKFMPRILVKACEKEEGHTHKRAPIERTPSIRGTKEFKLVVQNRKEFWKQYEKQNVSQENISASAPATPVSSSQKKEVKKWVKPKKPEEHLEYMMKDQQMNMKWVEDSKSNKRNTATFQLKISSEADEINSSPYSSNSNSMASLTSEESYTSLGLSTSTREDSNNSMSSKDSQRDSSPSSAPNLHHQKEGRQSVKAMQSEPVNSTLFRNRRISVTRSMEDSQTLLSEEEKKEKEHSEVPLLRASRSEDVQIISKKSDIEDSQGEDEYPSKADYRWEDTTKPAPQQEVHKVEPERALQLKKKIESRPSLKELIDKKIITTENLGNMQSETSLIPNSPRGGRRFSLVKPDEMFTSHLIASPTEHDWRMEVGLQRSTNFLSSGLILENTEDYEFFYLENFFGREHVNLCGTNPKLGGIYVSVLFNQPGSLIAIVRSKKGTRRFFLEFSKKPSRTKDLAKLLKTSCPDWLHEVKLTKKKSPLVVNDLVDYERTQIVKKIKVGILYAKEGQKKEEDMYCNEVGSYGFNQFLGTIGDMVVLNGFKHYSGGLDTKKNSTGMHSYFTTFRELEIMFHVSTLIPFTPNDPQQVERKRHLGNDVVVILFKEGNTPFNPSVISSKFNHVFIVIQPIGKDVFSIAVCARRDVPPFGPPIPPHGKLTGDQLREWVCAKVLNAERASMQANAFSHKLERTREQLLGNIVSKVYPKESQSSGNLSFQDDSTSAPLFHSAQFAKLGLIPDQDGSARLSTSDLLTIHVKSADMSLKTSVPAEFTVQEFIDQKLKIKFANVTEDWGLSLSGNWMESHKTLATYKKALIANRMKVTFAPLEKSMWKNRGSLKRQNSDPNAYHNHESEIQEAQDRVKSHTLRPHTLRPSLRKSDKFRDATEI